MKFKKKKKTPWYKNKTNIGIFIIVIMVSSTIGFMMQQSPDGGNTVEYNGAEFQRVGYGWQVNIQDKAFSFENLTTEVENVSTSLEPPQQSQKIYVADYPTQTTINGQYAMSKIAEFYSKFNIRVQPACMEEEGCGNIPIVGCQENSPVISIQEGNQTQVYSQGNCTIIQGKDSVEIVRATERYLYTLLGIMS